MKLQGIKFYKKSIKYQHIALPNTLYNDFYQIQLYEASRLF